MAKFIALYLPQFHPVPENDEWWGKGFTEWTNVARARKLFPGHKQPHIPSDLGFYDLRVPEVREQQAELAREAGVDSFCYYHYWFGNGKQLLERPFNEVVKSGKPDFPFCLCWANHSWYKKQWNPKAKGENVLLIEQQYPGEQDNINHFYTLLPAFKDHRYTRINGKVAFFIYDAVHFVDIEGFIRCWRKLAEENGLGDFFFVAQDADSRNKEKFLAQGFDAIMNVDVFNFHHKMSFIHKAWLYFLREKLSLPNIFSYKKATEHMIIDDCKNNNVYPVIVPNYDHTPRSGGRGRVLQGTTPQLFKKVVERALDVIKDKPEEDQIVIVKSWNEWAEGNYLEPDLEYGHQYIQAMRSAIDEHLKK